MIVMPDKPDDVPSLEELGDGDDLPAYWAESTTITVDRWVKESLDAHRDGRPWNQYLEKLRREHADPITINDVHDLAEVLIRELDTGGGSDVDYAEIERRCERAVESTLTQR